MCVGCDIFPLCRTCVKHNELLYVNATTEKLIHSCDSVTGSTSEQAKDKQLLLVRTSDKYADKDGLLWELPAAIILLYTLMINIKTNDRLINGASCTLKKKYSTYDRLQIRNLVFCGSTLKISG